MDALALLCNLHGDGPATLAALRGIGCEDLSGLELLGESLLADLLDRDSDQVQRFLREARVLRERIGDEEPAERDLLEPLPRQEPEPLEPLEVGPEPKAGPEEGGSGPVVEAVLELWHSMASEDEPTSGLLAEVQLSGLTAEQVVSLARAGVRTLDELAGSDAMALSEETGLAFTHLEHLGFLARRAGGRAGEPVHESLPDGGSAGPFA